MKKIKILLIILVLSTFFGCSRDKKSYEKLENRSSLIANTKYIEYDNYLKDVNDLKKDLQKFIDKYTKSNYYLEVQRELEKANTLISRITEEKREFEALEKEKKNKYNLEEAEKEMLKFKSFLEKYPESIKTEAVNERMVELSLIIFNIKTDKEVISISELNSLILLAKDYEKKYINKKVFVEEVRMKKDKLENDRPLVFEKEMRAALKMQDNDARAKLKDLLNEKFTWSENFFNTSVSISLVSSKITGQGTDKTVVYQYKVRANFFLRKKDYIYTATYHMLADDLIGVQENRFVEHEIK